MFMRAPLLALVIQGANSNGQFLDEPSDNLIHVVIIQVESR